MSRTLPAWIELSRPGNVLMGAATCILGGFMVGMGPETYLAVTLGGLSVALFMMAGNIVNDIVDSDIDAKAHPYRPIPSGRISKMLAKRLAIVAWTLSLLSMLGSTILLISKELIWYVVPIIWGLAAILMLTYDLGFASKNRGLMGNISISLLVGLVIIFGAASTGNINNSLIWFVAATALLINLSREIVKDCQDLHADEGRDTLPLSIGLERSRMIAYVIALAGIIFAALPYYIDVLPMRWLVLQIPAILLIISTNGLLSSGQDQKAQKSLRLGLLMGLIGFASSVSLS